MFTWSLDNTKRSVYRTAIAIEGCIASEEVALSQPYTRKVWKSYFQKVTFRK
jgi:hypothetical protein